jgi:soluble lytic murein transglycosylase-like protein
MYGQSTNNFELFFKAISQVESNNNVLAVGDGGRAHGIVQIHKSYLQDSNEFGKTDFKHLDCFDPQISKIIVFNYLKKYQNRHNWEFEKMAKLHNGGPNFAKKTGQAAKNLEIYWGKVKKQLENERQAIHPVP